MYNRLVGPHPPRVDAKVVYRYDWGDAGIFVPDSVYPYIVTRIEITIEPNATATGLLLDSTAWGYDANQDGTRTRRGRHKHTQVYPGSDFYLHFKVDAMSRYAALKEAAS